MCVPINIRMVTKNYILKTKQESVEEAGLLVLNAELTVNGSEDALHLSEREHTSEERIAGVVAFRLVAEHGHAVVHAHRQLRIFFLEDSGQLNDGGTAAEMACLCEIAVREDMT